MNLSAFGDLPPWEWPGDAGQTFLGFLRDTDADPSERRLAAEFAGDTTVINDELAEALLSIVGNTDEPERLRETAAIALGPALETMFIDGFDGLSDEVISEDTFQTIQRTLRRLYTDEDLPRDVRRRILEASVRAPEDWHTDAIREANASEDQSWKLTGVFGMQYVRGFDDQILEALRSEDEDIHYHAVCAAGNWELDGAWPHISGLLADPDADKYLVLAAVEAAATIRPREAADILGDLCLSSDEDIADAAHEALAIAEGFLDLSLDEED